MSEFKTNVDDFLNKFRNLSKNVDCFLKKNENVGSEFVGLTKLLYDYTKLKSNSTNCTSGLNTNSLPKLHLEGFGLEEIWSQINLENEPILNSLVSNVASLSTSRNISLGFVSKPKCVLKSNEENVKEKIELQQHKIKPVLTTTIEIAEETDDEELVKNSKTKGSIVDDQFFKLSEMEEFLKQEDLKDERERSGKPSEEFDVDLFADMSDSDDSDVVALDNQERDLKKRESAREATYKDFFDEPCDEKKVNGFQEEDNDEDEANEEEEEEEEGNDEEINYEDIDEEMLRNNELEDDREMVAADSSDESNDGESVDEILGRGADRTSQQKSSFEAKEEKIREKIAKLEAENLAEKPWQLKGEITADRRPENSLLEEHVQFEHTAKQAPLITEETTKKLEDIIKQRIKDGIWDDVERKTKPVEKPFEYKQRLLMDQEKSKASLAKVYEEEYLKKQNEEKAEKEDKEHKEIKDIMRRLFAQLDALSNFSFTPKPPESEVKIINNLPAVTVEEVTPATVSDAALLAPEEVAGKVRGDLKAETERDATDKKRDRRHKKKFQKLKYRQQVNKEKTQKGTKYSKMEASNTLKSAKKGELNMDSMKSKELKSSKNFFAKLNDEVHTTINNQKKRNKQTNEISSKKLKL
ncbi:U3 small nucleolar ribonucleoprotein MPP10-like protein [Leptotrombidium deliense]|uniref:U3 small nucleolar ribonucleoprotein protein MPP10 n=1 Tax=Leptotrombidium deliense TaxID=299467 RepID=A0A443SJN4_9ACAR|nr:U3 small nucleolar ribonucleoprotein MPP10-like protein [Leptotrombidium deliense]